jgi:hypothetical protein
MPFTPFSGSSGNISDLNAAFAGVYDLRDLFTVSGSNVGLGHSPIAKLDVNGQLRVTGATPLSILVGAGAQCYMALHRSGMASARTAYFGHGTSNDDLHVVADAAGAKIQFSTVSIARLELLATGHGQPALDNTYTWGTPSNRFSVYYGGTGTINTSDAREKTEVQALTPAEIAAATDLAREIGRYQFLDAVEKKGDAARQHIGMTVQRAIEILESHGLDAKSYGFICYDSWPERQVPARFDTRETGLVDSDGRPLYEDVEIEPARTDPAGDRYSFRPDELLLFIARGQSARQDDIDARLAALEAA